ncbi:predicted protein [Naegleria gruberi]|uniref:Predicted protein n=1 Tax=Naegleria gruberi TaxID=5762 RepID=D2VXB5_NAEGR|nr:uncharacterized protein NAEGRDRAFT_73687 [Naegleria gruberi]EFC38475.1 predicted protein [Naegleria gruberi]|eukprot:XP_002671219.1 predicted protein [Naegleria gruberi strain NEG-M]
MNQFDYLSNRHALLGLKNKEEINDYDYFLYQEYLKQEQERSKQEQLLKKDKNNTVNYDLIFSMDESNNMNMNTNMNINNMNINNMNMNTNMMGGVYNNNMMMMNNMMYDPSSISTSSYLYNSSLQEQQQEQQSLQLQPTQVALQFNINPSIGLSVFDSNSGKLEYRRAPSNQINEDFILNHEQLNQQLNQQYSGNALLLGEQASQALEMLNLTTFTVNNWSENMRKWMIYGVLIPTIKEIDSINLQMHKTIQFNCDFKGYDSFNPLDISPEYQHSIPNSIPHTEDTSKFTLKYVLATLVTQIDQQQQSNNLNGGIGGVGGGFNSGFGFSNGFNQSQPQTNQQKNVEFGNLLRRRLRLERYLSIPNLNLFDSTDKIACRKYVIDRIRSMSKGQFEKPNSRPMLNNSEQFLYEQEIYPTDEEIIVNLFCKFMDFTLDSHGHSSQFSNKYYCDQNIEKKENPHNLFRNRNMLAPGVANAMKKKRGLDKQVPVKKGLYLCKSKVSISHYNVEDDGNLYECQPGRNNVFYALVIFLHLINTKYDGYIDTVALSDLNLSQVIESY